MKLGQVVTAVPSLRKLAQSELTPKTLYWISKLISKMEDELAFYTEESRRLAEKYGARVEGDTFMIPPESRGEYDAAINEVLNVEIEANFEVVKLPTTENVKLSCDDLRALEGLVELEYIE